MDRAQRLLRSLPRDARIVEVGPSFSPLAPKRDGWNTFVIDHASRDELLIKYADQNAANIEAVDYVWRGGSLADAVPEERHGSFDAFIASHVIEHTTDIITFLRAAQTLLKPDGIVILAVPDKRKCFDFFRHPSATADAITAFHERRDRHTARTHIDYALNMAHKPDGVGAWSGSDTRPARLVCGVADEPGWRETAGLPYYTDAHAWVFVPSSFRLMIVELAAMGYLDLRVEEIAEVEAIEFHAWLRKGRGLVPPDELTALRTRLMDQVVVELAEQSRQIPDSPLTTVETVAEERSRRLADVTHRLAEAEASTDAMRIVLTATRASLSWRGLDRGKFKAQIVEASKLIPTEGPAAAQHAVLLAESRKMLGLAEEG